MEGFTDEEIAKAVDHCDNDKIRSELSSPFVHDPLPPPYPHLQKLSSCFVWRGIFQGRDEH